MIEKIEPRSGCYDMWNAFMVKGCNYTNNDMPISHAKGTIPKRLIGWDDAKKLHKKNIMSGKYDYHEEAFIHWYMDDQKFDGKKSSVWLYPEKALEIICHFDGAISPDFSTNADFPESIKRYNFYRMRAFDYWLSSKDIPIVYNVRWGTEETWEYCFDGIPQNAVVAIGTVASGIRKKTNRQLFEKGLLQMVKVLIPSTVVVYGSSNYDCFDYIHEQGIPIVSFPSKTFLNYRKVGENFE